MSAPCWRGCGRPAEPESLSCGPCRSAELRHHDRVQATQQAGYARDRAAAAETARGSRYVPCRSCGRDGLVLARWARDEEQEAERRRVESELRKTYSESEAFTRSIALTSPAGAFDPGDVCSVCSSDKYATFFD